MLPASLVFNTVRQQSPPGPGPVNEVRPTPPPPDPPPRKTATTNSLPIGRWAIRGRQATIAGEQVTEMQLLGDGRFTIATNARSTAFAGRWDGLTGKLTAHGASAREPALTFNCDLVYVEYKQTPASSYLLGNCASATERWTWEMTPISSGP
jgi:hypothetical protein